MPETSIYPELLGWFGFLLSAGFGNPIPEEVMMVMGGIRASQMVADHGAFRWLMFPACLIGAILADLVLYSLGLFVGVQLFRWKIMARIAPAEKVLRFRENFDRYGIVVFIMGRLVPGIRTTMFLTAGAMRLNLCRFLLADCIGALIGGSLFFFLGYGLGSQFEELIRHIEKEIAPFKPVLLLSVLAAISGYLIYQFYRHPISTGDPEEVPLIGQQIAAHLPGRNGETHPASSSGPIEPTRAAEADH